jgi:hypothetical protein
MIVAAAAMVAPFGRDHWNPALLRLIEMLVVVATGSWVGGVLIVVLVVIGAPFPLACLLSYPVSFLAGRMISSASLRDGNR